MNDDAPDSSRDEHETADRPIEPPPFNPTPPPFFPPTQQSPAVPPEAGETQQQPPSPSNWGPPGQSPHAGTVPAGAPSPRGGTTPVGGMAPLGSPSPTPLGGTTPMGGPLPASPSVRPTKSRKGLVIAGVLLVCLLVGAAVVVALGLVSSAGSSLDLTSCVIEADGTLRATGTLSSDDETSVTVDFIDSTSSELVDSASVTVAASDNETKWTATAKAGDEVERVVCKAHI